jgi:hypothetical protein
LQEVRFKGVEFLELGDGQLELFSDVNEDIAFLDGVDVLVRLRSGGVARLAARPLLEHRNLAGRKPPGCRGRRGDIPFPFHGALEAGLNTLGAAFMTSGSQQKDRAE